MATERMAERADLACVACRKQKRRCDKTLPECSLCTRMGRICQYAGEAEPPATAAALVALQRRLSELEERLHVPSTTLNGVASSPEAFRTVSFDGINGDFRSQWSPISPCPSASTGRLDPEFPAALFLDIDCFVWSGLQLPDPSAAIPADVLALLSKGNVVTETSARYFGTIHAWFPIISKKRMDLGTPLRNGGPDVAMLFLAMKLVTAQPDEAADGTLYSVAKSFINSLAGSSVVSLVCLQAMILVALYEYSHAIYPAAWMSVGACTRYAEMLGLSCGEMDGSFMRRVVTWTELEERRRVWWAVFILDRLISMGSRRSCCLAEPISDGRLPGDDDRWQMGDVTNAWGDAVSTHYEVPQSYYARLCQAAIYVGRAGVCARNKQHMSSLGIANVMSLAHELISFGAVMDHAPELSNADDFLRLLAPRFLVGSALFITLDPFTCPEKLIQVSGCVVPSGAKPSAEHEVQSYSMQIIQKTSRRAHGLAMELLALIQSDDSLRWQLGKVSPFMLDLVYCSIATFHWLLAENGDESNRANLDDLKPLMDTLGSRWVLSHKYLRLASFHDR